MKRILSLLCLTLLLAGQAWAIEAKDVEVEELVKSALSWDGKKLPAYPDEKPEITILRITVQPGVALPLHHHPVINVGVLIKGELTVITEKNETLHLKAGDPIIEVVDKLHYGKNEGTEPAEIIVFYAGTAGNQITVKD